ncbi:MAG: RidA family protein [Gammaproteobacteria bacterium]|nr:RidA family protein [Gammaproteobacteria bacterium]NIR82927.1 RidA family protein [Gammaproteobacteria bacterium]NIR90196.1 RidA family protein [Gammaproteobacteria bacterium]NIU04073.1 RidA family protein [Gammaproteobacteria bacterium]NIV51062.1 RidA family protein [Gammaproteobacteria bacterium]
MSRETIGGSPKGPGGLVLPFSKAVRAGDFIFVSGQMGFGPDGTLAAGGIEPETRQALENIKAVLSQAECTLDDVVKCTAWLDDPRDFAPFNKIYGEYFGDDPPARSTVHSQLVLDAKVEVEAIAYKPR